MKIKFWGTRGSIPVPGKHTIDYGGNTPCVEFTSESNKTIILDGGSGLRECGNHLIFNNIKPPYNVFLSHYHWDHIQGIPFFAPLYINDSEINFYGFSINEMSIHNFLSHQMTWHNFPIELDRVKAKIKFIDILPEKEYLIDDIKLEVLLSNHSSPTLSYKIKNGDTCIVYMTDNELDVSFDSDEELFNNKEIFLNNNKKLVEFCKGCDYLIHDSMYNAELYLQKKGWGHSSNSALAMFGILAEVKNLVLYHYNPDDKDKNIDEMFSNTKEIIKLNNSEMNCIASKDGLEIII
ncbi:MAG: MBL fold metallo-hydrolase [Bacteroidota bacterium]|nr:MBL fold metallo-hydrolase [Bacteroidota bacterium]